MLPITEAIDAIAHETEFSGVVSLDRDGKIEFAKAYGLANRALQLANTVDTRFAMASGSKGLTALAVLSLIETGALTLGTTARSILGTDLPLIDDAVTVEHLLAHRSGIGDYLDEDDDRPITDYLMPVPVHALADVEQYLPILDGHPAKFPPGERFSYCNGGFAVLALLAERAGGIPFHQLVRERVIEPAGLADTDYFRSDELPARTALGYLPIDGADRTNIHHLPVRGGGDGGAYTTTADVTSLWQALFSERILSSPSVAELIRPRSNTPHNSRRYGLGIWLHESRDIVQLEGYDAGVSFRSTHDPDSGRTYTVLSNSSEGAWPIARHLDGVVQSW